MDDIYIEPAHYPDRRKGIYREIQTWENYELRNNIAYEMAIRNENNLSLLVKYKKLLSEIISSRANSQAEIREVLSLNQTILLAFEKYGEKIRFKSFNNLTIKEKSSDIYGILHGLNQAGFTIEAIGFYISMDLISHIEIFDQLEHIDIYYALQDTNNKYHDLNTYFTFDLGSTKVKSTIATKYIEDHRGKLYNVVLEKDGLYAYRRTWIDEELTLRKVSQINPATRFRAEVGMTYKLCMSRPLMQRPYQNDQIQISININKPLDAIKEEVELIIQSISEKCKKELEKKEKLDNKFDKEMLTNSITTPGQRAFFKLYYYTKNHDYSNSSVALRHHAAENIINRPKNSNTKGDHRFFSDGLYIYDCYHLWRSHRRKLKEHFMGERLKAEEIPYKDFIDEMYKKINKQKAPAGDHMAKKYLLAFERYIEGGSYREQKKYYANIKKYHDKQEELYNRYLENQNKMDYSQKSSNIIAPEKEEPKYFSLI